MTIPRKSKGIDKDILNSIYPIKSVIVYEGGVMQVKRESCANGKKPPKGERKAITYLSQSSLNRLAFVVTVNCSKLKSILTLTYGIQYPLSGRKVKADLNRFLVRMRRKYKALLYVWFLEFQKRSAPHFHIFLSLPHPSLVQKRQMAIDWVESQKLEGAEYSRVRDRKLFHVKQSVFNFHKTKPEVWEGIRSPEGAKRYAVKYALKTEQKEVPPMYSDVGRFWGCSRQLSNPQGLEVEITQDELREYLWREDHRLKKWDVLPKYIW